MKKIGIRGLLVLSAALFATMDSSASAQPRAALEAHAARYNSPVMVIIVSRDDAYLSVLAEVQGDPAISELALGLAPRVPKRLMSDFKHPLFNSYRPQIGLGWRGAVVLAVEDYGNIFREWGVISVPSFLALMPNGELIPLGSGKKGRDEIVEMFATAVAANRPTEPEPQRFAEPLPPAAPPTTQPRPSATQPYESARLSEPKAEPSFPRHREPEYPQEGVQPGTVRHEELFTEVIERERRFSDEMIWTIELETRTEGVDLDLAVYNESGDLLAVSESLTGQESLSLAVAPGHIYTYRVYSAEEEPVPSQVIIREVYQALPSGRTLPGPNATVIEEDVEVRLRSKTGERTQVRFTPTGPAEYRFRFVGGNAQFHTRLLDEEGRLLSVTEGNQILYTVDEPITLVLDIDRPSAFFGDVTVQVEKNISPRASVSNLTPGAILRGQLGGGDGVQQVYPIRVNEAGTWRIALEGSEAADIDMELLTGGGQLLWRAESPDASERIDFDIAPDDDYRVRVYRYRGEGISEFALSMSHSSGAVVEPPDEDRTEILIPGRKIRDRVGAQSEEWYTIIPSTAGMITIYLVGAAGTGDLDLAVYSSSGERLAISQAYSAEEAVLLRASAGEALRVKVFSYGESTGGEYTIWFGDLN